MPYGFYLIRFLYNVEIVQKSHQSKIYDDDQKY